MFKVGIGHSLTANMIAAAESLVDQGLAQLDGNSPQLGLLFSTHGFDHATLLEHIGNRLPRCQIIGGASWGEVSSGVGYRVGSSVLILFVSDTVRMHAGVLRDLRFDDETHNTTELEKKMLLHRALGEVPAVGMLFPDGLGVDGASIVKLFTDAFPGTRFFGGAAAEDFSFNGTAQFFNREVLHNAVPYVLFYGPLRYSWAVTEGFTSGWIAVGERLDAECDGVWIKTINGRPAVEHLESRFRLSSGALSVCHPVAIYPERNSDTHYFRDVYKYSTETGAIESMQLLPASCQVQLTQPDPSAILEISRKNIQQALAHYPGIAPPAAVLWLSCVSRAIVLANDPSAEYSTAIESIPANIPVAGFYTYGEIAPSKNESGATYHSSTLVTLALGEEPTVKPAIRSQFENFLEVNLQHENTRLASELEQALRTVATLQSELAEHRALGRIAAHSKTELNARYRGVALQLLCALLDSRSDELRAQAFKGNPPRLNKIALARMLNEQHLKQFSTPFPMTLQQLARILAQI